MNMLQVIQGGVAKSKAKEAAKCCPFCGEDVGLPVYRFKAFYVGCDNGECGTVQFAGATPEEAVARWNARRG